MPFSLVLWQSDISCFLREAYKKKREAYKTMKLEAIQGDLESSCDSEYVYINEIMALV